MESSMLGLDGGRRSTPSTWGLTTKESLKEPNDLSLTRLGREPYACASYNVVGTFPPHLANKAFT
jgi:hypothetical protein